ncbi:MAG: hypothetical protein JKY57_02625, partial [Kordiimonadaceae bacterium]|nr:hypothetical protein [Kordiimonadaceae bacterium]
MERGMLDLEISEILQRVSDDTGEDYFLKLVHALNAIGGFDHAFVAEVDLAKSTVTTLSYVVKGKVQENVSYDLEGTPCSQILDRTYCRYSKGVAEAFPNDEMLIDLGIQGYVGYPLLSQRGVAIGILVLLNEKPIEDVDTTFDMLRYFARHCECELERMNLQISLNNTQYALDQAVTVRQSILRNVSHELRTPLNAIIGFPSLLGSEIYGPHFDPRYKEY